MGRSVMERGWRPPGDDCTMRRSLKGSYTEDMDGLHVFEPQGAAGKQDADTGRTWRRVGHQRAGEGSRPRGAREFPGSACCSSFLWVRRVSSAPSHRTMEASSAHRDLFPAAGVKGKHGTDLTPGVRGGGFTAACNPKHTCTNNRPHSAFLRRPWNKTSQFSAGTKPN